jgi:glutathione S-transferase
LSLHDNQITRHKISLALSSRRDNHPPAATAEMAILIVAVLPSRLSRYNDYSIADIAVFPWYGGLVKGWSYGAAEFLSVQDYTHVQRWADHILTRPAVKRGRMVNRTAGQPSEQLHERHDTSDFETRTQDRLLGAKP